MNELAGLGIKIIHVRVPADYITRICVDGHGGDDVVLANIGEGVDVVEPRIGGFVVLHITVPRMMPVLPPAEKK